MASQLPSNDTQPYKQSEPLGKRRRIGLACSACRARKSRCDGQRPSCSTCTTLALECLYEPSESSTNVLVRKEYMSSIEQRLKDVERALQRHDDLLTGHLSACSITTDASSAGQSRHRSSFSTVGQIQNGIQPGTPSAEDPGSDEAKTDGLAIAFVDEQTPAFYGESSNIAFTRYLLQAISVVSQVKQRGMTGQRKDNECSSAVFSRQHSPSAVESPKTHVSPLTLPPGEEMDALLGAYFSTYGSMFPFLHEPTFRDMYENSKASGFTKVRKTWLGLLNMIFALASNIDQRAHIPAKERLRKSYVFFLRAVSLCSESTMRTISLDIAQYLLLAVLYLQGTQRSIQTWSMHGILVRTAMALGLHSEQSGQGLDPVQQEIRRRTWLTIYCLDKFQSVSFGRPPSIPDEYIVVNLPAPWPSATDMPRPQPDGADINTDFLNATVRLYQIIGRSITTQYGMNLGLADQAMDESTAIQAASARRQELRRWASSLSQHLSLCQPGSEIVLTSTHSNRLRVILTLRHHFASILIHRPLLCATLRYLTANEGSIENTLPYGIRLAIAEAHECIRSAESTIEIVYAVLSAHKAGFTNLGVWFFTLFYVFTSSLIILSHSILAQHGVYSDGNDNNSSIHPSLTKAIEALDMLDSDNRFVRNCAKFIRYLAERQIGQAHNASRDQQDSQYLPGVQEEGGNLDFEQAFPSFDLPALTGLIGGGDLESNLFNPFLPDFNLNFE